MESYPSTSPQRPAPPAALAPVSTGQAVALLRAAIDVAGEAMAARFGPVCKAVLDELSARWEFESNPLAMRRLINDRLLELRVEFLQRLKQRQEALADALLQPGLNAGSEVLEEDMSLLDAAAVSATTVAQRAGSRIGGRLEDEVRSTHMIVRFLAGRPALRDAANPFGADVFCYALVTAAESLDYKSDGWDYMLRAFEPTFTEAIGAALHDVIEHFVRNGLDPRVVRRDLSAKLVAQRAAEAPRSGGAEGEPVTLPGFPTTGGHPSGSSGSFSGPARLDAPQADPSAVLGSLLARLHANAHDLPPPSLPRNTPPEPALLDAVSELQRLGLQGLHGATLSSEQSGRVTEWRAHLVDTAGRTVDKLTIELVGMLFDRVLQNEQVPAEIKSLLSRLQIPVLKAALLDADFFAASAHPARRLIDRLAASALGWEPYGEENEHFRAEVERVVGEVLTSFEKNVAVFDRVLAEFDRFLGDLGPREGDPLSRAKRALEDAERREVLSINLSIQVRRAFEKVELETYLRDFLLGPWVQVLVAATLRDAQTAGFSKRFREAIHDIVWSVQPKANLDDRKRLTTLIPELIRVPRDGLALTHAPEREAQEFFRQLMQSHAVAIKPVDQATYIKSVLTTSEVKSKVDELQVDFNRPLAPVEGGLQVSNARVLEAAADHRARLHLPASEPAPVEAVTDRVEAARLAAHIAAWARGDWFELIEGEGRVRLRLRWVSPLRTLFLFSANREQDALALTAEAVKAYVQRGRLRPLADVPLTQRAVDEVLRDFEHSPQKATALAARFQPAGA
ncbi:MAG: DUF1631 family protein [Betaproteobacteria bacterium]